MKSFLLYLFSTFIATCYAQNLKIPAGEDYLVFIEARSSYGNEAGSFGDIFVLDVKSMKKYRITDDIFYDSKPVWSPDGRKIAFLSNREGSSLSLAIKGVGFPYDLCVYDIEKGTLSIVYHSSSGYSFYISSKPAWTPDSKGILVSHKNNIYKIDLLTSSISLVTSFKSDFRICDLKLSPNKKYLVINYTTPSPTEHSIGDDHLAIYSFLDSTITTLARAAYSWDTEWFPDGENVLFWGPQDTSQMYVYQVWNPKTNRISLFELPKDLPARPSNLIISSSGKLFGVMQRDSTQQQSDLFYFDPSKKIIKWLSHGENIDDISLFMPFPR